MIRAGQLIELQRYPEALAELSAGLAEDPDNAHLMAQLAYCQHEMGDKKALETAKRATGLDPEGTHAQSILASILIDRGNLKEAEKVLRQALLNDSESAQLLAMLAVVQFNREDYKAANATALEALRSDPDSESAHWVLTQTKSILRHKDVDASNLEHLAKNPESPMALQSRGLMFLRQGQTTRAYEAFRDALRLDPHNEGAREGLKEALRSKFWPYKMLLAYAFFTQRFGKYGYLIGIALWVISRALRQVARDNPALRAYLIPVIVVASFFVFGWVYTMPVLNLVLLFHPFGRYALTQSERWQVYYCIVCFGALFVALGAWLLHAPKVAVGAAIFGVVGWVLLGLTGLFEDESRRLKWTHAVAITYFVAAAVVGGVMFFGPKFPE